jgi:hypothetical protein
MPQKIPFNQGLESGSVDRVPRTQAAFAPLETDHLRFDPDTGHSNFLGGFPDPDPGLFIDN